MMKSLFLIIGLLLFSSMPISAHVLESANNIGVIIHIDPEDDPIVNEPASIFFEITDKTNKFSLDKCSCVISISKSNTELLHQTLSSPSVSYTFPEVGIYTIKLIGDPISQNDFDKFTFSWDFRITKTNHQSKTTNSNKLIVPIIIVSLVAVVIVMIGKNKRTRS